MRCLDSKRDLRKLKREEAASSKGRTKEKSITAIERRHSTRSDKFNKSCSVRALLPGFCGRDRGKMTSTSNTPSPLLCAKCTSNNSLIVHNTHLPPGKPEWQHIRIQSCVKVRCWTCSYTESASDCQHWDGQLKFLPSHWQASHFSPWKKQKPGFAFVVYQFQRKWVFLNGFSAAVQENARERATAITGQSGSSNLSSPISKYDEWYPSMGLAPYQSRDRTNTITFMRASAHMLIRTSSSITCHPSHNNNLG